MGNGGRRGGGNAEGAEFTRRAQRGRKAGWRGVGFSERGVCGRSSRARLRRSGESWHPAKGAERAGVIDVKRGKARRHPHPGPPPHAGEGGREDIGGNLFLLCSSRQSRAPGGGGGRKRRHECPLRHAGAGHLPRKPGGGEGTLGAVGLVGYGKTLTCGAQVSGTGSVVRGGGGVSWRRC